MMKVLKPCKGIKANRYSVKYGNNRYISQMFNYGSNDHQLIEFELSSFQYELHGEDSLFMHNKSSFGVADGGKYILNVI